MRVRGWPKTLLNCFRFFLIKVRTKIFLLKLGSFELVLSDNPVSLSRWPSKVLPCMQKKNKSHRADRKFSPNILKSTKIHRASDKFSPSMENNTKINKIHEVNRRIFHLWPLHSGTYSSVGVCLITEHTWITVHRAKIQRYRKNN